jgi:putative tryptophan/tyrosine transport system substrate-binding protein
MRISPPGMVFGLALTLVLAVHAPEAQQAAKIYQIGYLGITSPADGLERLTVFRQGLRDLGYVEGRNVALEIRYAEGKPERLPDLAAELIRLKVDVIVTQSGVAALAAKKATQTIPIVMESSGDAVTQGLVASLARPGGNVTGMTLISPETSRKRLELLRELLPRLSRVGVLWCGASEPLGEQQWTETQEAARLLDVQLSSLEVRSGEDLASAFASATKHRVQAVLMFDCSRLGASIAQIVELARKHRLPAMYPYPRIPRVGGLMSYGANHLDPVRRPATYVDKILKGAKPADLPVEQPTKFELVINLSTARALGLIIPPSIATRVDQVIQ